MKKNTKRIISFIVAMTMIAAMNGYVIYAQDTESAAKATMYGDTDNDRKITASDALNVLKAVVKLSTPDEAMTQIMDVDGDSDVTATDALMILKYVVKLIDHFDVEDMEPEQTENVEQTDEPVESTEPTITPTENPAESEKPVESTEPTKAPTPAPTEKPTESAEPTYSEEPTTVPTESVNPTEKPVESTEPTSAPTEDVKPTVEPSAEPTTAPTAKPTDAPAESETPTVEPSDEPTAVPTDKPTDKPVESEKPSEKPTETPTPEPTPTPKPTVNPSYKPAEKPEDVDPSRWPKWHGEGENPPKPNTGTSGYEGFPNVKKTTVEDIPKELLDDPIELGRWVLRNGTPIETTDVSVIPCPWCLSLGKNIVIWKSWEATDEEMRYHNHYFCNGCGLDFGKSDQYAGTHTLFAEFEKTCQNYTYAPASFRAPDTGVDWNYRFSLWCTTVFDETLDVFDYGIEYPAHCHYQCTVCGDRW